MKTLLFAAILYLVGIIAVLLLRPSLMFDKNGQWKEFGTLSNDDTIFPFWLFCVVWAAVSYCMTLVFISDHASTGIAVSGLAGSARFLETESPEDLVHPLPSKKKGKTADTPKPGYYILDAKEMKKSGVPKYIYVGKNSSEAVALGSDTEE